MKRISFKVAKAIAIPYLKNIVSPKIGEENTPYGEVNVCDALQEYIIPERYMRGNGKEIWGWSDYCFRCVKPFPTYFELWLWLWREKGITIEPSKDGITVIECKDENSHLYYGHNIFSQDDNKDPEESIIIAIEYLVDNDLIK